MKIVVLDGHTLNPGDTPWSEVEAYGPLTVYDRTPPEKIAARAAGASILLTNKTPLDAATLAALPDLRLISVLATGYNVVDTAAARERGITVCNVPGYGTDSVAEFVMALILEFHKRVAHHHQLVSEGAWERCPDFCFWDNPNFHELSGKTLGIVGFGEIGRRVGEIASVFRMKVLASSRTRSATAGYPFEWAGVDEIFRRADVVSLHCPLTPETQGLVHKDRLALMKPGAFLINTARGPLVVEKDLREALDAGILGGAACDVLSVEPPRPDNPLPGARNLILTPHIAWATREARARLMRITAGNIGAFLAGSPVNVVNP